MRILCTADIHIGRISSRLPREVDASRFTSRASWARIVDLAIGQKVDVLAVAGDVIDASGNYFEAFGPLKTGLRKLSDAGIETFFIAGNHDFNSLPRFCDQLDDPRVHLLGRGATWQRHTIERDGARRLHIDGWSFRAATHDANPLLGYHCPRDGTPVLGLLHADVEQTYSPYARCAPDELLAAGPGVWLLGHIHRTRKFGDGPFAFYPGSPQALDPGERGPHGAWLLDWPPGGAPVLTHCPLSTIRYEPLGLLADGCDDEDALVTALHTSLEKVLHAVTSGAGPIEVLSCRVHVHGHTRLHTQLARDGWPRVNDLRHPAHGITALVDYVTTDTRPVLDLDTLALGNNPAALLARQLLALEQGKEDALVVAAQQRLETAFHAMQIKGDNDPAGEGTPTQRAPDIATTRALMLTQGHQLLGQLVETRS